MSVPLLVCSKCGEFKPVSEFRKRSEPRSVRGYSSRCRECARAAERSRVRVRSRAEPDYRIKRAGLVKENRAGVPDGHRRCIRCKVVKRECVTEFGRRDGRYWCSWCKECRREVARERQAKRRANPVSADRLREEKQRHAKSERGREWKRRASEIDNHKRRQRRDACAYDWDRERWDACVQWWGGKCAYCDAGGRVTQDHFIPLSAADCPGTVPWNIVPACGRCNGSKGRRDPFVWLSDQQRLDRVLRYLQSVGMPATAGEDVA